ncbi:alpha/beta hydrolase-fold protein [Rhodococcus aerolatus]
MLEAGRGTPATLSARLRRKVVGVAAAAVVLPTALALALPASAAAAPAPAPAQVSADAAIPYSVSWVTDRQLALTIQSPVMRVPITVGILLPRTWNSEPGKTYPAFMLLDGFRVPDTSSDWFNMTDIEQFFRDKDTLVVTAYGGEGSFYSNWETPDPNAAGTQGQMQWDTFWNTELPQVLSQNFRFNGSKAIGGLSMGGTAAFNYATLHPGTYKAAASYSGYLSTTSPFFPQLIQYSISSNTDLNPNNLWGDPATDPAWPLHDPTVQVTNNTAARTGLQGMSLYVSAGNGAPGPYDGPSFLGLSPNYVGQLLEIAANYSSQQFTGAAQAAGVTTVKTDYYNGGTHSWPYWQRQLEQSWPQIGAALGLDAGAIQGTGGCAQTQFASIALAQGLGNCTTPQYNVPGGVAQDFFNGRAFLATGQPITSAGALKGRIGAKFQDLGGTGGTRTNPLTTGPANVNGVPLGLPITGETAVPGGAYNDFSSANTHIYWSPATDAHEIGGLIYDKWTSLGRQGGELGFPVTDESVPNGRPNARWNGFQGVGGGQILFSNFGTYEVKGAILATWLGTGGTAGPNGLPTSDETPVANGLRQTFEQGAYTFVLPNGPVVPS